jgi:leucyl-tRNA synthetase
VEGVELDLAAARQPGPSLTVFTPYADALADARFVLLSPRHGELSSWASEPAVLAELEEMRTGGWERAEREAQVVPVLDTGRTVSAPVGGQALPVLISPVVDSRFGPTAVLGIPERDRTDELIARRLRPGPESVAAEAAREGVRADPRESATPRPRDQEPRARPAVRYRARDFSVSRQRYWGTPIPIVYCDSCGIVPVPREQLPVVLPADLKPSGAENPLARDAAFFETQCPRCHGGARRETDTLDGHFDALWLWIPACVPAGARDESLEEILALPELRAWLPSERLVAGSDSGNFMFDQRIATKALRDIGPLAFLAEGEPFAGATMHEMVIRDGRKMSKHLGNVVEPDELVAEMGADTVRLAVLYAASPQRSLNWSESAVTHCHRFLNALWVFCQSQLAIEATELPSSVGEPPKQSTDHLRRRLSMWCETGAAKIADALAELEMHTAVRNVMRLFERIRDFQGQAVKKRGELSREDHESLLEALRLLLRWLEPLAPHIAAELLAAGFERPRSAAADLQTA